MSSVPIKRPVIVKDLHTGITVNYLDIKDASNDLGITVNNLYKRIADGKPFKLGRFLITNYEQFYRNILEEVTELITSKPNEALKLCRWALDDF